MISSKLQFNKGVQVLYSPFIHPEQGNIPIEYYVDIFNDMVQSVSFKIRDKPIYSNVNDGLSVSDFLTTIVQKNSFGDVFTHQLGFIEAIERLYDISDNLSSTHKRLKIFISEFERIIEHSRWLSGLFANANLFLSNEVKRFVLKLQKIFEQSTSIVGKNIESCLSVGRISCTWEEDYNNVLTDELIHLKEFYSLLREKILFNSDLHNLLFAIGIMDTHQASRFGTVGPIARASGIVQDLRIDDPYWDYLSIKNLKTAISYDQDLYGLIKVILNEISVSFDILNQILAKNFSPKQENVLDQIDMSQTGDFSVRLESSKGPTIYSVTCIENMIIKDFGLSAPTLTNIHSMQSRMKGVHINQFNRIIYAYNLVYFGL